MKVKLLCSFVVITHAMFGQISSGKTEEPKAPEVKPRRIPTEGLNEFTVYGGVGIAKTFRILKENEAPFGDPVGTRANETEVRLWTYQLGVRNRFAKSWSYDAGLMIDRYGEDYSYDHPTTDSSFSYQNRYSFVAVPIQLFYTYGKDFRWFVGGGIQPMLVTGFNYTQQDADSLGNETETEYATLEGLNGIGFNLIASAGVQWRWNQAMSVYFCPSYAYGLVNTFDKQEPYKHYVRGLNFKFGLAFHFPDSH